MRYGKVPQALPAGERQGKAAAFNQKNIRPALPEPGEFDDFWRGGLA